MIEAFFYRNAGDEVPIAETSFWIAAAPRKGETITLSYWGHDRAAGLQHVTGEVVDVQWTFEQTDTDSTACTVDVSLRCPGD